MSLERHRRQFQQQNDKQLELHELMLPEAESEILQNDMELVPAIDGNSDMYLLVPASATASQEQSLQSLIESGDYIKSDNIERNSDMLMQESEDTPAAQVLQLPENGLKMSLHDKLVEKNELNEETDLANKSFEPVLELVVKTIAEAAKEIQNKKESEQNRNKANQESEEFLSANISKAETGQGQEMVGVALEELKTPEAPIDTESSKESQIDLQFEGSESQSVENQLNHFSQEKSDPDHTTGENFSGMGEETENSGEISKSEVNPVSQEANENYSHISSFVQTDEAGEYKPDDETTEVAESQCDNDNDSANQSEDMADVMNGHQLEDELKHSVEDTSDTKDEIGMKLGEVQIEQISKDTDTSSVVLANNMPANYDSQDKIHQLQDVIQASSLETSTVDLMDASDAEANSLIMAGNTEEIKNQDLESQHDKFNELSSNEHNPVVFHWEQQLISEPFNEENPTSAEQVEQVEEHATSKLNEDKETNQIQMLSSELEISKHEPEKEDVETQNAADDVPVQDDKGNAEHIEPSHEIQLAEESESVEDIESNDNLKSNEEVESGQDIQANEEYQNLQEEMPTDNSAEDKRGEENTEQTSIVQTEEVLPVKNTLTFHEAHNDDETAVIQLQPLENSQPLELHQTNEDHKSVAEIETVDQNQSYENVSTSNESEAEDVTEAINEDEVSSPHEDVQSMELNKLVESFQSAEPLYEETEKTSVEQIETEYAEGQEIVKSEESPAEMESLPEETTLKEGNILTSESVTPKFSIEQESVELAANPTEASNEGIEVSYKPEENEEYIANLNVLADESTLQANNQTALEHYSSIETQKPSNNLENILSSDKIESEPEKDATSIVTTMEQVLTSDILQKEVEQQITADKTKISTTLKPLNVLDSVLNYVNASFMNQMNNDNGGDHNQEIEKEEQVFNSKLRRYDGAQVWRIVVQNDRERKLADEIQTKYDGQLWKEVKQEVDYLLKPQVLAAAEQHVRAANLSRIVLIDNLQKVIEVENPSAEEIKELQNRKGSRLTWQAYHRLDDIHSYFDYMSKTYPDICSVEVIGYSIEKRPLKLLKISNGNANNPGIWIDGGMHAREWISPAVVTFIAHQIIEGWDDLPAYMQNINWYIHAVANPDGYEYSHTTDRLWRKNMRSHGRACPGVDLNRNFGYKWGGKGTSANPCSQTYRGSKAFSEPETFYISKFISNFPKETFKAYLSFHSYGQYILYPWGYDYHMTTDMSDLDLVARQAGTIMTKSTGAKYTIGSSATTLYPAAGGSDDWAKGIAGIKYSYTIEMGDTGRYGFVLPADYIEPNGKNGFTIVETVAKAITMGKNARRRKLKAHNTHTKY